MSSVCCDGFLCGLILQTKLHMTACALQVEDEAEAEAERQRVVAATAERAQQHRAQLEYEHHRTVRDAASAGVVIAENCLLICQANNSCSCQGSSNCALLPIAIKCAHYVITPPLRSTFEGWNWRSTMA